MSKPQLTHGSLFAGIEGFGLGFTQAGFSTVWAVEKEPFCQAIIRTHFPGTEIHSDVHDVGKHNLAAVDVLTAGFPCQDLSVAGKRAGLGGARSGLFWQAHRIIGELQPPWFVIENVPGLFSSNSGRDFAVLLRGLDELGYGLAWRVLDSQFFGVAQRRRRVFIVGCLGNPCPEEVLFESEGGEGDFAEGGETWTGVTDETPRRISPTIHAGLGHHGWACGDQDFGLLEPIAFGANDDGRDASENIAPTVRCGGIGGGGVHTAVAFAENQRGEIRTSDIALQLSCSGGKPGSGYPAVLTNADEQQQGLCSAGSESSSAGNGGRPDARESGRGCGPLAYQPIAGTIGSKSGGCRTTDLDGHGAYVSTAPDPDRMRSFTELPEGLDSARYRALGNAVTANVAKFIAERIKAQIESENPA